MVINIQKSYRCHLIYIIVCINTIAKASESQESISLLSACRSCDSLKDLDFHLLLLGLLTLSVACSTKGGITELPNIVFMMANDMGYGDVRHCGGPAHKPGCNG